MDRRYAQRPRRAGARPPVVKRRKSSFARTLFGWCIPFFVVNTALFILVAARPHITLKVADTSDFRTTTASITVRSLLPLTEFTSTQEDQPLTLTETAKNEYVVPLTRNGVIALYAKCINGMTATVYEHVDVLDDIAPIVGEDSRVADGVLTLILEDSQSGVDWDSVYASSTAGVSLKPASVDKKTGTFTFDIGDETLNIHASDMAGNAMQAAFSKHMDSQNTAGSQTAEAAVAETKAAETKTANATDAETKTARTTEADTNGTKTTEANTNASKAAESSKSTEASTKSGEISIYIDTSTP